MKSVCVLIPTFKPEANLVGLVDEVLSLLPDAKVLLVRDGCYSEQDKIFTDLLLRHDVFVFSQAVNLGKGRALKSGFNEILCHHPEVSSVVTADGDGQHLPKDIAKIAQSIKGQIVLGGRFFERGKIPLKSAFGNGLTKFIFRFAIGLKLNDTQTGLRGIPRSFLPSLLTVAGERYEFETSVLILAKQNGWQIEEVPIQTVYINQNRGSHFNPIVDSMRIYFLIFRFFMSSIMSSVLDFAVFSLFISSGSPLKWAFCASRLISGIFNFILNKKIVFKSSIDTFTSAARYWLLVFVLGTLSYFGTKALVRIGMNVYLSKILVEGSLFAISFTFQRDFIFTPGKEGSSDVQ